MRAELQMDSGPRLLRYVVLGAIVAAFAIGVVLLMRPGESMQVAQAGTAGVGAAAAMPSAVPAEPATPPATADDAAPTPNAGDSNARDSAAPAPAPAPAPAK